jgi:nicotinate-nucleotide pyrophosphorylase (carboxylating)
MFPDASVERVLWDNFSIVDLAQAVRLSNGKLPLEASGNIDENTILAVAKTGVDYNCVKFSTSTIKGKLGYFCMADLIAQPIDPAAIM